MKKVLLLSLGLVMGLGAFAQEKAQKSVLLPYKVSAQKQALGTDVVESSALNYATRGAQSVVVNEDAKYYAEAEAFYTTFDLQSNGYVANRMYQLEDGSVAVTATMSLDEFNASVPDRGTGYNFCATGMMDNWGGVPETRIEANATGDDMRTGWPSIAPYGAEGEILVNHSTGLNYWIREKAGEGTWDGPHAIPNPTGLEGQEDYEFQLSWPRIVTTGENNDVVHIFACAQHQVSADEMVTGQFYLTSSDLTDWSVNWSPLVQDEMHLNVFSADDYVVSANGNNIAVVYCGGITTHAMLYLSKDAGQTWESRYVWENPYCDLDWETDENSIFDEFFCPTQAAVAVGADGVAHVALSVGEYAHRALGWSYNLYYGLYTDGIAYWNSERETPLQSPYDDNPNNALKLWWPVPEDTNYIFRDTINFCGYFPPHPETGLQEFNYEKVYTGSSNDAAGDYLMAFGGLSAYPAIAVDPAGNVAVAYSAPDMTRMWNEVYYLRNIYVSYKPATETTIYGETVPGDRWYVAVDNFYQDFVHTGDESTFVSAVSTPVRENEFWFSCLSDDTPGFYSGSNPSQSNITTSTVNVFKYNPTVVNTEDINETIDVVYNIFPNPATDYVCVSASMDADATITFSNIAGQTVKVVNTNLTVGDNTITVSDLTSGVYFCTVNANGYSHTSKVVVK